VLTPTWDFTLPDPGTGNFTFVDFGTLCADDNGHMDIANADLGWHAVDGLFSTQSLGHAPAGTPTPEQCRDAARSRAAGNVPMRELTVGSAFCVVTSVGNAAWVRLTRVQTIKGDVDRVKAEGVATVWVKTGS